MSTGDRIPTFRAVGQIYRFLWRSVFRPLLLASMFFLLVAHVVTNVRAGRALEAELQTIRDRGEPLTLREGAPPPVPDDQNAAPLYKQAFRLLPRLKFPSEGGKRQTPQLDAESQRILTQFLSEASQQ